MASEGSLVLAASDKSRVEGSGNARDGDGGPIAKVRLVDTDHFPPCGADCILAVDIAMVLLLNRAVMSAVVLDDDAMLRVDEIAARYEFTGRINNGAVHLRLGKRSIAKDEPEARLHR